MCKLYLSCCGLHCLCKFPVHSGFIIFVSNLCFLTFSNVSECLFQVTHIVVNICTVLFVYSTCTSILSLHVSSCLLCVPKLFVCFLNVCTYALSGFYICSSSVSVTFSYAFLCVSYGFQHLIMFSKVLWVSS
jgi:hypothetical protein